MDKLTRLYNVFGWILILDGLLSLIIVEDKKILWQIGRLVRTCIGIFLVLA